jgi:hypothetical protein
MTTAATALVPESLTAIKEQARRARDEAARAREREEREAADANWATFLDAVRATIPAELLLFAAELDRRPPGFCGGQTVREVVFDVPGHVPLRAVFERGSQPPRTWTRRTSDGNRLPLDAPNAAGRPQWRCGPFPDGYFKSAVTLGEALLLAEQAPEEDDGERVNLPALAAEPDDDNEATIPF